MTAIISIIKCSYPYALSYSILEILEFFVNLAIVNHVTVNTVNLL